MNSLHFQYFLNLFYQLKKESCWRILFSFLIGGQLRTPLEERANGEEGDNAGQVEQDRGEVLCTVLFYCFEFCFFDGWKNKDTHEQL